MADARAYEPKRVAQSVYDAASRCDNEMHHLQIDRRSDVVSTLANVRPETDHRFAESRRETDFGRGARVHIRPVQDIIDLKRASARLVRNQPRRLRFGAFVEEAVAQLMHYRDWFDDPENRAQFRKRHGLSAYRPRVVAIIGRDSDFPSEEATRLLLDRLPNGAELKTYDDVLRLARTSILI